MLYTQHPQAYNDLTRTLICTTRAKQAGKAPDIPKPERCLTLDSDQTLIKQLFGVARPKDHLPETAAPEPDKPLRLRIITAFRDNTRACSNNAKELNATPDDDLKSDRIIDEKVTSSGSLLYRVKWHPTLLQKRHVHLFKATGTMASSKLRPNLYSPVVRSRYLHMA